MNGTDPNRRRYLDYRARCHQAFTPFSPIELPEFFAGREHVIDDIRNELIAPGRQVAIYGERGVGKTSLATLLSFFADYDDAHVHLVRCHEGMTFDEIGSSLLEESGRPLGLEAAQTEASKGVEARVGPLTGRGTRRTSMTYRPLRDSQSITPTGMLRAFGSVRGLLIIDEFDRVQDATTKTRVAEMIKAFSDARSETKVVIVGVAETLEQLIGVHQSLSRSLAQIGLRRMEEEELNEILRSGSERTGAAFDPVVAKKIVRLADGFPYFVHLVGLYASIYAGEVLLRGEPPGVPRITDREYQLGLRSAVQKSEHSLQEAFERATVTTRRKSDIYDLTLRAMALSDERDVQVRALAGHASFLTGDELRPEKFSNALGELVKSERGHILTKVRDGFYKFTNPLMRPYVRFLLELDNLTRHGGQMEFPFMRSR